MLLGSGPLLFVNLVGYNKVVCGSIEVCSVTLHCVINGSKSAALISSAAHH